MGKLNRTTEEVNALMDSGAAAIAGKVGSKGTAAGAEVFNDYEGKNVASGECSHAEGCNTAASGTNAHAEGTGTEASGANAHAEGQNSHAAGISSHAEGNNTRAQGANSHAEGNNAEAGTNAHAEGTSTTAAGDSSHAEGYLTVAGGQFSHTEGSQTHADGIGAHAEGANTYAMGDRSHTEGENTTANGVNSHAEGSGTTAYSNTAHAEGKSTYASGDPSHAEGYNTKASGAASHAEGRNTEASGAYSHAEGDGTKATNPNEHACGKYNVSGGGTTTFSIGIGTSDDDRKNAFEVHGDGKIFINGIGGYTGNGTWGHKTLQDVINSGSGGGGASDYPNFDSETLDSLADGNSRPLSDIESAGLTEEDITGMASGTYLFLRDDRIERTYIVQSGSMEGNTIVTFSYGQKGTNDYVAYKIESDGSNCTITKYTSTNTLYFHDNSSHGEIFNDFTNNEASGNYSHAEGTNTEASGSVSHAEGYYTKTTNDFEHAEGSYNASHTGTRHSIGIGLSSSTRKNAVEAMDDGRVFVYGIGGYDGTNPDTAKTLQEVIGTFSEKTGGYLMLE